MKKVLFLFSLVFIVVTSVNAQCSDSISLVSQNGSTYVYTTNTSQAYFWTVTGNGSISGSNTMQTVTVVATGEQAFDLSVTTFKNGECCPADYEVCPLRIEQDPLNMCISSSTPSFKKRGLFFLYDCDNNSVLADWRILEGNQNFQFAVGPNNTSYINVKPNTVSILGNITVQAFVPGTNILLANLITEVYDCDVCSTCRLASGNSLSFNNKQNQIVFANNEEQKISIEIIDINSGNTVYSLKNTKVSVGNNFFNLEKAYIKQSNKVYIVKIITESGEVFSEKFLY